MCGTAAAASSLLTVTRTSQTCQGQCATCSIVPECLPCRCWHRLHHHRNIQPTANLPDLDRRVFLRCISAILIVLPCFGPGKFGASEWSARARPNHPAKLTDLAFSKAGLTGSMLGSQREALMPILYLPELLYAGGNTHAGSGLLVGADGNVIGVATPESVSRNEPPAEIVRLVGKALLPGWPTLTRTPFSGSFAGEPKGARRAAITFLDLREQITGLPALCLRTIFMA